MFANVETILTPRKTEVLRKKTKSESGKVN